MRLFCSTIHKSNLAENPFPVCQLFLVFNSPCCCWPTLTGGDASRRVASGGVCSVPLFIASERGEEWQKQRIYKTPATCAALQELLNSVIGFVRTLSPLFVFLVVRRTSSLLIRRYRNIDISVPYLWRIWPAILNMFPESSTGYTIIIIIFSSNYFYILYFVF